MEKMTLKNSTRVLKTLLVFNLAFSSPILAFSASNIPFPDERSLREICSTEAQVEIRECLSAKVDTSQKALLAAEEKAAKTLAQWDEDSKYIERAQINLTSSNTAFARYRERQCGLSVSLSGAPSGSPADHTHEIRRLACIAAHNNWRVMQLRDVMADIAAK